MLLDAKAEIDISSEGNSCNAQHNASIQGIWLHSDIKTDSFCSCFCTHLYILKFLFNQFTNLKLVLFNGLFDCLVFQQSWHLY